MRSATTLQSTSEPRPPRASKSASREIFRKSRASRGRSAGYRFVASQDFAYAYEKARQDRQSLQTDPVGYEDDFNLYAYVANDPLNRNDPTGLYTCGTERCSDEINQAVADIRTAHESAANEETRTQLGELVGALGEQGDKGVNIVEGDTNGAVMTAGVDEDGNITVTMNPITVRDREAHPGVSRQNFAADIGHEVRHGIDQRNLGNRNAATVDEVIQTERNAYRDSLNIARGLYVPGLTTSSYAMTSDGDQWINAGVAASLSKWCAAPGNDVC